MKDLETNTCGNNKICKTDNCECENGYYLIEETNECETCPAGYECSSQQKTACSKGTYSKSGQATCDTCEDGTTSGIGQSECAFPPGDACVQEGADGKQTGK